MVGKKALSATILAVILSFYLLSSLHTVVADENVDRHYAWSYGGKQWTWDLSIPKSLYDSYKSIPVSERIRYGPAGYGLLASTKDSYVVQLADELRSAATSEGYGTYDEVSFVLAFVQSLPYTSDSDNWIRRVPTVPR
jgi:hypothetical protein